MAWSAPKTAVDNGIWYAADYNKFIRNNLRETAPAKATAAGQYFVSNQAAVNSIITRSPQSHTVTTSQTSSSTSFANLGTVGPTVTVTTGTVAAVFFACRMQNDTANFQCHASVAITGASNVAAHDNWSFRTDAKDTASQPERGSAFSFQVGLKPGSNVFTMKYKVGGGTGTFSNRHMVVLPLS